MNNNHTEKMGWPDPYQVPTSNEHYKTRMLYAQGYFTKRQAQIAKIGGLKRKFTGQETKEDMEYIIRTYVKNYRVQYHDYRLSYRVIMQMVGEWLRRPINSTAYAINSNSMIETKDAASVHIGLHYTKNEVAEMRQKGHGDPYDGLQSAYDGNDVTKLLTKLNSKQTRTMTMQLILNNFVKKGNARDLLYINYLDTLIASECFSKMSLDATGRVVERPIDNRRIAFIETEGDFYLEKSPFIIEQRPMGYAEIIESWPELKEPNRKEDLLKVKSYFSGDGNSFGTSLPGHFMEMVNGENKHLVYSMQFKIYEPQAQKRYMQDGMERVTDLDPQYYSKYKHKVHNGAKYGKYELSVRHRKRTYECTMIGPEVMVGCGPVKDQITNPDDALYATYDYSGLLFNTVAGKRTSIQELTIELDRQYNVTRLMMNRELAKFKGTGLAFNRGMMPRSPEGKVLTKEEFLITLVNDGLADVNTSADGNEAGEQFDVKSILQQTDLGLSKSFDLLMRILYDIEATMYKIVGFNQERLGETPASSTVTNATNNLINSQASTSPLDYFFDRYTDKVFQKYIEKMKISLAFYHKHEGDVLLGPDLMALIRADENYADDFYGTYTADSRRDDAVRNKMSQRGETSVAAGEVRNQDLMRAEIAETIQEAAAILDQSWDLIQQVKQQQDQEKNATMERMNQQNIEAMNAKDIRDKQHEIGKIIVQGAITKAETAQKAMADYAKVMQQGQNKKEEIAEKANLETE